MSCNVHYSNRLILIKKKTYSNRLLRVPIFLPYVKLRLTLNYAGGIVNSLINDVIFFFFIFSLEGCKEHLKHSF